MADVDPSASRPSLRDLLAEILAREPRPQISVALTTGSRVNLDDWELGSDCLIERWPSGSPRYLVPIAQIVTIEIQEDKLT